MCCDAPSSPPCAAVVLRCSLAFCAHTSHPKRGSEERGLHSECRRNGLGGSDCNSRRPLYLSFRRAKRPLIGRVLGGSWSKTNRCQIDLSPRSFRCHEGCYYCVGIRGLVLSARCSGRQDQTSADQRSTQRVSQTLR